MRDLTRAHGKVFANGQMNEIRDVFCVSIERLIAKIKEKNNPSVAGLDPVLTYIPSFIKKESFEKYGKNLKGAADAVFAFNKGLIDGLYDVVPAVKPQAAYYEMYGFYGMEAFYKTIAYAKDKGLYVIADVKRNDIGSTAEAYAKAYLGTTEVDGEEFEPFGADSVTLNPYLGTDSIAPFLDKCETYQKSVFVLVKTSNKSSGELQDVETKDGTVYLTSASLVNRWGVPGECGYSNVGAVVGATYPEQAAVIRKALPHAYFLVPGYGAQGGGARDVVPCFNPDGLGAIVNSSRGIMCAYQRNHLPEEEYAQAARAEAIRMRDEIMGAIL